MALDVQPRRLSIGRWLPRRAMLSRAWLRCDEHPEEKKRLVAQQQTQPWKVYLPSAAVWCGVV